MFEGAVAGIAAANGSQGGPQAVIEIDVGGTPIRSRITRKSCDERRLAPGTRVYAMGKAVAIDRPARGR